MRAVVILAVQQTISDLSFSLSVALPVSTSFVVERETESERERKRDSVQTNEGRLGRRFRCGRRCRKQICHNNYGATPLIGSTMRCVWFFLSPSFPICLSVRLSACLCACVSVRLCVWLDCSLALSLGRSRKECKLRSTCAWFRVSPYREHISHSTCKYVRVTKNSSNHIEPTRLRGRSKPLG